MSNVIVSDKNMRNSYQSEKPPQPDLFVVPKEKSLCMIQNYFKDATGCVVIDYIEVPITCPYTLKRMVNPCRTFRCQHIQCFDAVAVPDFKDISKVHTLQAWKCPICGKPVTNKSQVYIDKYFLDVLHKSKTDANIQIFPDGTWETLKDIDSDSCDSPIMINDSIIDLTNDTVLDSTIIDLEELDITVDEKDSN